MKWQRWVWVVVVVFGLNGCVPLIQVDVNNVTTTDSNVTTINADTKVTNGVEAFKF